MGCLTSLLLLTYAYIAIQQWKHQLPPFIHSPAPVPVPVNIAIWAGTVLFGVCWLGVVLCVLLDIKLLRGRRIPGHKGAESWATWKHLLAAEFGHFIFIPWYSLARDRMRRNRRQMTVDEATSILLDV